MLSKMRSLLRISLAVAVVQGMDAVMIPPLRGYMSKTVHVEDQGMLVESGSVLEWGTSLKDDLHIDKTQVFSSI